MSHATARRAEENIGHVAPQKTADIGGLREEPDSLRKAQVYIPYDGPAASGEEGRDLVHIFDGVTFSATGEKKLLRSRKFRIGLWQKILAHPPRRVGIIAINHAGG